MASLELNDAQVAPALSQHLERNGLTNGIEHNSIKSSFAESNNLDENSIYYPYPTNFELTDRPIDEIRKLDVAVIGAGLSGITAGILLPAKVPGIKLTIFDKNSDVV